MPDGLYFRLKRENKGFIKICVQSLNDMQEERGTNDRSSGRSVT